MHSVKQTFRWTAVLLFIAMTPIIAVGQQQNISKAKSNVEAYPNNLEAHQSYLKAVGFTSMGRNSDSEVVDKVVGQYQTWINKFPKSAVVPFALGVAFAKRESPDAKPYLMKTVKRNPDYAKAWYWLFIDAARWGKIEDARKYIGKESELNQEKANCALYRAKSFRSHNYQKYREKCLALAKNYPDSKYGFFALYVLSQNSDSKKEKIDLYKKMYTNFPPGEFSMAALGMREYFEMSLQSNPKAALDIAEKMLQEELKPRRMKMWKGRKKGANSILRANKAAESGKADEAADIIDSILSGQVRVGPPVKQTLLLAENRYKDQAGHTTEAYKSS